MSSQQHWNLFSTNQKFFISIFYQYRDEPCLVNNVSILTDGRKHRLRKITGRAKSPDRYSSRKICIETHHIPFLIFFLI